MSRVDFGKGRDKNMKKILVLFTGGTIREHYY